MWAIDKTLKFCYYIVMSENQKNSPEDSSSQPESHEPLSPQLALMLVKTARVFAGKLLKHSDKPGYSWIVVYPHDLVPGETVDPSHKGLWAPYFELQYGLKDTFLGNLRDWDARLFSFKDQNLSEKTTPQLFIQLPLEPVEHPALEVIYRPGKFEVGASAGVEIIVPFESPARIKECTLVDKSNASGAMYGPEGDWRAMTEVEGTDLLADITDLTARLDDYIQGGGKPVY
jgi:hypothetical protein